MGGARADLLFEPVSDHDTEDVQSEFYGDKLTPGSVFGGLGRPHGNNGVEDASSPSINETS